MHPSPRAYRDAAALLYGPAWADIAYSTFALLSERFFDGTLSAARPIRAEFLPWGRCFAMTHGTRSPWNILPGSVRFDPRHLRTPQGFAETMLDEMGHVSVGEGWRGATARRCHRGATIVQR